MKLLIFSSTLLSLFATSQAAVISLPNLSFEPDGSGTTTIQQTNIQTPNGGSDVLQAGATPRVAYLVTKYTFGVGSDAHLRTSFRATGAQPRLGVEVQDTGQVQFTGSSDGSRTSFNFGQDMAGQTVVLLAKLNYDQNNNITYGRANNNDDTLMNVWVNPIFNEIEGPVGLSAGDMSTVWNSATFRFFNQEISNQNTPGAAGTSFISNTVILTGADATFRNAIGFAVPEPSSTALFGLAGLALMIRRRK